MKNLSLFTLWGLCAVAACAPVVRDGIYGCKTTADCPERQFCDPGKLICYEHKPAALGSAGASASMLECSAGLADCNGNADDACETDVTDDLKNCGGCGLRCQADMGAVASCDEGSCMQYVPNLDKGKDGTKYGGDGGSMPFDPTCPPGQIMFGAAFTVDPGNSVLVNVEPRCAAPRLERSSSGEIIVDHGPLAGSTTATVRDCAADTAVTAIRVAVQMPTFDDGQMVTAVTRLDLGCSKITFGPGEQVMSDPVRWLQNGVGDPMFPDECPDGQAVVGFTGAHDILIGSLQMQCAKLVSYKTLDTVPAKNN